MKKFFLGALFLFAIPVFAQSPENGMAKGTKIKFSQGWNLVSPSALPGSIYQLQPSSSETYSEHLFVYGFDTIKQKYVGGDLFTTEAGAKNELEELPKASSEIGNKVEGGGISVFLYLNKKQTDIANSSNSDLPPYQYATKKQVLLRGWNFLSITPAMAERRITDFKGNCVIKKAYALDYDAQGQNFWNDILDESLNTELAGYGFVVQVENNCSFNFVKNEPIPSIPTLPN